MSTLGALELDFFHVEKADPGKLLDRRPSFRDIQGVVSKMNPELLKTVIASGSATKNKPFLVPSTPTPTPNFYKTTFPALPVLSTPSFSGSTSVDESKSGSAPLTIFYNGNVSVFYVSPQQAENILKFAHTDTGGKAVELTDFKVPPSSPNDQQQLLDGDLPIARKKSLQRFLQKRKERMSLATLYVCPTDTDNE